MKNSLAGTNVALFYGVVEDINDPLKVGRVRVRAIGYHSASKQDVPTAHLPWAQVVQSHNSAATGDVGSSPTGLMQGSWVVGVFIDGVEAQQPLILGAVAGIPNMTKNSTAGFNDPADEFPRRLNVPDVNRLARNELEDPHPVLAAKANGVIQTAVAGEVTWAEPDSAHAAEYPHNHVMETRSGHIKEYDDTLHAERIHEYHTSGTFYEINADGDRVVHVVGDGYDITIQDKNVYVGGVCNITIIGDANISVGGDVDLNVTGNMTTDVGGSYTITVEEDFTVITGGNIELNP